MSVWISEVESQYTGARIEGDVVTLDFVKKMMEDFKNQRTLHQRYVWDYGKHNTFSFWSWKYCWTVFLLTCCKYCRYAFQIVLQTKEMLQKLPSLVDINVPNGKHFTVCGDVHGQVITFYASYLFKFLFLVVVSLYV